LRSATDDEILGLDSGTAEGVPGAPSFAESAKGGNFDAPNGTASDATAEPENLRDILEANPDLRRAWHDAQSYRTAFATPDEARAATAAFADLDRMDALFYSRRPEDHAELARAVASLDPVAFASLATAMNSHVSRMSDVGARHAVPGTNAWHAAANQAPAPAAPDFVASASSPASPTRDTPTNTGRQDAGATMTGLSSAQADFFHAANAAAVEGVLDAIESQVERLLPDGVSKSARNRVVGEIYRELDTTLRSNRQLAQQMRDAFSLALRDADAAGGLDASHQRAIVSLVTGRARQALPGVAKRVLNEWTSTIVAANHDRRARQRAAESRVDIAGSSGAGNDARRALAPRDLDYARLSDADILNL